MSAELEGLPEGVRLVAYRAPQSSEFILEPEGICQMPMLGPACRRPAFIIEPQAGYSFFLHEGTKSWLVLRTFATPKTISFTCDVANENEELMLLAAMDKLPMNVKRLEPVAA